MFNRKLIRILSFLMVFFFFTSSFGAFAQDVYRFPMPTTQAQPVNQGLNVSSIPQVQALTDNLGTIENTLLQIDQIARPLYNQVAPSNMETMNIGQRINAIVGNAQNAVQGGMQNYKAQVGQWNAANGITPDTSFEGELGVGLNKLGLDAGKMPLGGNGDVALGTLKGIIDSIKATLQNIIRVIRAKITSIAQKVGLINSDENSKGDKGKSVPKEQQGYMNTQAQVPQYADDFEGKISKGIDDGAASAKQSLKSSFSLGNIALTTTIAVGTNLAIQYINGQKPSLPQAINQCATVEFAGSVVGGALGAAGGQFFSTMVQTFIPGPIGTLVGTFIPVLGSMIGSQMGSSLAGDVRGYQFDIGKAVRQIDFVNVTGSAIGSTIGMALGAPIPILGPIVGGIVGGVIGGKVANWLKDFMFHGGNLFKPSVSMINSPSTATAISIGSTGQSQGLGLYGGGTWQGGMTPVSNDRPQINPTIQSIPLGGILGNRTLAPSSGTLSAAEQQYYQTYLNYNKALQDGNQTEAKKAQVELDKANQQYNNLKKQAGTQNQ
ncbi:MAG: hypothetical protein HQM08_05310 [Candidatus Riflebacteria bacterium]|nr:hypothetical protein [Candidatus Riflebacteria bacterium]